MKCLLCFALSQAKFSVSYYDQIWLWTGWTLLGLHFMFIVILICWYCSLHFYTEMKSKNYDPTDAIWYSKTQDTFIEMCIKEVEAENHPRTHIFLKLDGLTWLKTLVKKLEDHIRQLKNKWNNPKKIWVKI